MDEILPMETIRITVIQEVYFYHNLLHPSNSDHLNTTTITSGRAELG